MFAQNPTIHIISERAKLNLSDALKYFVQTVTDFLQQSAENKKNKTFVTFL